MKIKSALSLLAATALLFPATHLIAQDTGTSHPEQLNDSIDATTDSAPHYKKPSPAVPVAAPATENYGAYTPYVAPGQSVTPATDSHYVAPVRDTVGFSASSPAFNENDPNSGVVTSVPMGPNDLPVGTRIVAHLNNTISTKVTVAGTRFAAELAQPVVRNGNVLIPAGSVINGRITQIHGGRRISGASAIRLQADQIVLPSGASYRLDAEVVDIDHYNSSHVNREGIITNNTNGKVAAGATALTTTTGLVAGAMIGGGVGAVVGAGIGAGLGTYWWLREDHQQVLPTGTEIVFSLNDILSVAPAMPVTSQIVPAPAQATSNF